MPSPLESHIQNIIGRKKMAQLEEFDNIDPAANIDPAIISTASSYSGQVPPLSKGAGTGLWDKIANWRNNFAESIAGAPEERNNFAHDYYMEKFADAIYPYLSASGHAPGIGETLTRGALTTLGNLNESAASILNGTIGGKDFVGPQGIDVTDLEANDKGIERALRRWRGQRSPIAMAGPKI